MRVGVVRRRRSTAEALDCLSIVILLVLMSLVAVRFGIGVSPGLLL